MEIGSKNTPYIAILGDSINGWNGGIEFIRFCVSALNSVMNDRPQQILLSAQSNPNDPVARIKRGVKWLTGIRYVPVHETPRARLVDALDDAGGQIEITEYRASHDGLADALRRCRADVLFPCPESLGTSFPHGWIGYIPDLQHKRLAHWFREEDCKRRDEKFARLLDDAPVVVVNAAAVVEDIQEFYPNHNAKVLSLPYCPPAIQTALSDAQRFEIRKLYNLPEPYFIISNQFWIHKSHKTAFQALQHMRNAGYDVSLICTGSTSDYRWPNYFNSLKAFIQESNLRENIRILGQIPKRDQLAIMSESIAVIQPTLFEGGPGGGAVYDAVSLNKPCIVSDIPVNREIDIGVVRFFAAGSGEDLAAKMIDVFINRPEMPRNEEVLARLRRRQTEFAAILLEAAGLAAKKAFA